MQETEARILATLQHAGPPLPLHAIAAQVGRSPSATLRRLAALVDAGRVHRDGHRKEARYTLAPHVAVDATWDHDGRWLRMDWTADGIDWMFPLAGRVQGRRRVEVLLRRAFSADLLHDTTVVVFGSAARHEGRADSDVDILVLTGSAKRAWKDLAVDMELQGEGTVDVTVAKRFERVPPNLRRAIIQDGRTVFSSASPPFFVEALRTAAADG